MTTLFILLAAGQSSRFSTANGVLKQLAVVRSKTLLQHAIDFVPRSDAMSLILSKETRFLTECNRDVCSGRIIETTSTCDTIAKSPPYPVEPFDVPGTFERVVWLFTDVYWTEAARRQVLEDRREIAAFTDGQDIFAWSARGDEAIVRFKTFAAEVARSKANEGRTWEIARAMGYLHKHPVPPTDNHPLLSFIVDETQDFDTIAELQYFERGIPKRDTL